jgi:hypothetical protein
VYLIVFFIVSICIAIWVVLFLNKPNKTQRTGQEARKGGKQFVFSSEKRFVASPKTDKPERMQPEKPKSETIKMETPAAVPLKTVQSTIQAQEPLKNGSPPKTETIIDDSSKKSDPQSNPDNLDFDHLSELIDNFFIEDKNPNDSQ